MSVRFIHDAFAAALRASGEPFVYLPTNSQPLHETGSLAIQLVGTEDPVKFEVDVLPQRVDVRLLMHTPLPLGWLRDPIVRALVRKSHPKAAPTRHWIRYSHPFGLGWYGKDILSAEASAYHLGEEDDLPAKAAFFKDAQEAFPAVAWMATRVRDRVHEADERLAAAWKASRLVLGIGLLLSLLAGLVTVWMGVMLLVITLVAWEALRTWVALGTYKRLGI